MMGTEYTMLLKVIVEAGLYLPNVSFSPYDY